MNTDDIEYQLSEVRLELANSINAAKDCARRCMDDDAQTLMDRVLRLNVKRRALLRQQNPVGAGWQGAPLG